MRPASQHLPALDLQVPAPALGAISAAFAVVPLLIAVPMATLVHRIGERRLMGTGSVITAGSTVIFLFAGPSSLPGLVAANAVLGAGHLCCVIGQQGLVADSPTFSSGAVYLRYRVAR